MQMFEFQTVYVSNRNNRIPMAQGFGLKNFNESLDCEWRDKFIRF